MVAPRLRRKPRCMEIVRQRHLLVSRENSQYGAGGLSPREEHMSDAFDWHGDQITRHTMVDAAYRNTRNVRRFMLAQCGASFRFDRDFMAWIRNGERKTMGEVAEEWLGRHPPP